MVGETPNLAARLQGGRAEAVVICASTRKLIGNLFDPEDLGAREVKGSRSQCMSGRRGPSAVESRFEALHATTTPLVGRDEEIELLLRRWQQAKTVTARSC